MSSEDSEYPAPAEPPFYGTGPLLTWEPKVLLDSVDRDRLLKSFRCDKGNSELESALDTLVSGMECDRLFKPSGFYGYFPVITDDDLVIMLDPADFCTERVVLRFPRMPQKEDLSLADYLRPEGDVLGIQMVTIGNVNTEGSDVSGTGLAGGDVGKLSEGLVKYLVEDLADRVTLEITRGLMLPQGTGLYADFGSPGMPVFEEQRRLFEFLGAEERLGITMEQGQASVSNYWRSGVFFHK